jgi:predicted GNAT family acetyltransferase
MEAVEHDVVKSRWILKIDGEVASALMYADHGDVIAMVSTFTNPKYRGRGLAAKVVEAAVADAEERERKVSAGCWYVAQWFEKHPEVAYLLAD